ncbi:bifunctional DNA-formamidopyrimidine glycosylase/DNA-(apurinic or apyrimidinic site) lyase [Deltaproteobacteria bacterium TL4]
MPELPEVETVRKGLEQQILGQTITQVEIFRERLIAPSTPEAFNQSLRGKTIVDIRRRAKYLIFHLTPESYLIVHLRMTGKFIVTPATQTRQPHDRLWFHLENQQLLIFSDIRCFGTLQVFSKLEQWEKHTQLGEEPLSQNFNSAYLKNCCLNSKRPIKDLLLDQNKIAGIGNIYASEILFDAQIDPRCPANQLSAPQCKRIVKATQKILKEAILKNGTSISDFRSVENKTGEFQAFLKVYGKTEQPCVRCQTPIQKITQQQRSSFFCPSCQH